MSEAMGILRSQCMTPFFCSTGCFGKADITFGNAGLSLGAIVLGRSALASIVSGHMAIKTTDGPQRVEHCSAEIRKGSPPLPLSIALRLQRDASLRDEEPQPSLPTRLLPGSPTRVDDVE
jgi:hypothetical protein